MQKAPGHARGDEAVKVSALKFSTPPLQQISVSDLCDLLYRQIDAREATEQV